MEHAGFMRVAVDAVVFSIFKDKLSILLIRRKYPPFKDVLALPGGFVKNEESLEKAAKRELEEETNVKNIFLKQLGAYGEPKRDPRGRIVSVAFLALISADQSLKASTDAVAAQWYSIDDLPKLGFDHESIVKDALKQLRYEIQTTNLAFQILPKKFTLTKMQNLYAHILGMVIDKRNFRKRIKELDMLKETKETFMEGAHRPALLYEFKDKEYSPLKERLQVFV
jgi:8-oxo-dGTP diphosphatase